MGVLSCGSQIDSAAHGNYFDLEAKYARMKEGVPNPLIDPDAYKKYVAKKEQDFLTELAK
jgi:metallo-beta-lactamase class B